ncbi:MAG TPA: cyclic pyranopterin monophosphate synthase MoaC [Actinobacteria bacterium]|nr:cyclic pyranopterin monophosphate synthase MoaC [Actinomycetota bacterium]
MDGELTHLDAQGRARMVDVGDKAVTRRSARAEAVVAMQPTTVELLADAALPKGDALAVARLAAIQGAKRTPELVPLCHPLPIDVVEVDVEFVEEGVRLVVEVGVEARTGVEMEALVGASVGALALYDMIKGVDRGAEIRRVRLLEKRGGRSGVWVRD